MNALTSTIFFGQRRVENWECEICEGVKEKAALEGEKSPCHTFPEKKNDILETASHYPKLLQGLQSLRGVLGVFWDPEAQDICVTKANTSHILAHMLELAGPRRPRVNQSTNTGTKLIPSTNLYVHVNISR